MLKKDIGYTPQYGENTINIPHIQIKWTITKPKHQKHKMFSH